MTSWIVYACLSILLVSLTFGFIAVSTYANSATAQKSEILTLPSDIAQMLRDRNREGRGGCPGESSIFIHGFHYLDTRLDRTMWFLGAPDYLCETNSFISLIVDSGGKWTVGMTSEDDELGNRMLAGVPVLFQHSSDLGYFLISEWQIEGPSNFLYYSADGVTWSSVNLPATDSKNSDYDCCSAASIQRLCIVEPGAVFVSYDESEEFHAGVWSTLINESFPGDAKWSPMPKLPDHIRCAGTWPNDFVPRSLREKTADGAVFDISHDRAVLIPGLTK